MTAKRRIFSKMGLPGKTVLLCAAAAALASVGPWIGHATHQQADIRARAEFIVLRAADALIRLNSDAIKSRDAASMAEGVEAISRDLAFDAIAIFDADGLVLASAGEGAALANSPLAEELRRIGTGTLTDGPVTLGALSVIGDGGETSAVIVIRAQHSAFNSSGVSGWTHFGLTLLSIVLLSPGMLLLARAMPAPTAAVADALSSVRPGKLSQAASALDKRTDPHLRAALADAGRRLDGAYKQARILALQDVTTKLPNRNRFIHVLDARLAKNFETTVLIADLDGFRKVNELVGPRGGDEVLAEIANRLRAALRSADQLLQQAGAPAQKSFIARLGADQFGLILPTIQQNIVARALKLVGASTARPVEVDGRTFALTASFGGAHAPHDAKTAAELMKLGEIALKAAKRQSTDKSVFYDASLLEEMEAQATLEDELRQAVDNGDFVAVFQPKIHLDSGEVIGAEALARWRRPDGSVVSPGVFIPKAEEMGLISKLGVSVLRSACEAAANWNRDGRNCRIAVNVSPLQFHDPDFIPSVYETLEVTGLDPEMLELEITESAAINDHERVARIMRPLRARGVRLSIDDFGTGHSNFTTVTRLPFDVFKIDQQFVRALSEDPHAPAVVEMILAMAETMGQETVAEGVETEEQAAFLRRRACTVGQGYFFSPPLPHDEFLSFLKSWRPEQRAVAAA